MYNSQFSNYFGAWNPKRMPPKVCERVGCDAPATVVAVANHANWYLCDTCAAAPDVTVEVRLVGVAKDKAETTVNL